MALFLAVVPRYAKAEFWVSPEDYAIRADIQRLADAGVILAPVTTYPLMWNSFIEDVNTTDFSNYSRLLQEAALRVKQQYRLANAQPHTVQAALFTASKTLPATSFGSSQTQPVEARASYAYHSKNTALKVAVNYRQDGKTCFANTAQIRFTSEDIATDTSALTSCDDASFDNSYLAYRFGNWIARAGATAQFWGPGLDTSLILSTNAKPLPAISLTRDKSTAFVTPWLHWLGQWNVTSQMARLESERVIANALLWSTRVNIRPLRQLEVALSWSAQWAGSGQPSSANDFFDLLTGGGECIDGSANCDDELVTRLGNQLAGVDIRWADNIASLPYAIFLSTIGEDTSGGIKPVDRAYLGGVELYTDLFQHSVRWSLEFSDTGVSCTAQSTTQNCYYEHDIYQSGYRYYGKAIGSTYDNDAQAYVLSAFGQFTNGNDWQVKLKHIDYNNDDADRYPNNADLGNSITKSAYTSKQVEVRIRQQRFGGRLTLGALVSHNQGSKDESMVFAQFEYRQH